MKLLPSVVFTLACTSVWAQAPAGPLSFEAASIHASEPGLPSSEFHTRPGSFMTHNVTLRTCIEWAYDMRPLQISGPDWLRDVRFDITARAADHNADDDQLRLMLQTLLNDRFGMKMHREQKEQQVYSFVVAKGGPKFHSRGTKDASSFVESTSSGPSGFSDDKTGAMATRVSMAELADKISQIVNRIVTDRTGLTGRYDLRLDVTPYMPEGEGKPDFMGVIFAGFNDQLGLRLESGKENVSLVVIDSINRTPTEN